MSVTATCSCCLTNHPAVLRLLFLLDRKIPSPGKFCKKRSLWRKSILCNHNSGRTLQSTHKNIHVLYITYSSIRIHCFVNSKSIPILYTMDIILGVLSFLNNSVRARASSSITLKPKSPMLNGTKIGHTLIANAPFVNSRNSCLTRKRIQGSRKCFKRTASFC